MESRGVARRATIADVEVLVELRAEMFRTMGKLDASSDWRDAAREWFAARIDDPSHCLVVVESQGRVVASATGSVRDSAPAPGAPQGGDVLITNVCTFPAHRGCGFGRLAFDAVLDWARGTGAARAELMATEAGRDMYERTGFSVVEFPAMRLPLMRGGTD